MQFVSRFRSVVRSPWSVVLGPAVPNFSVSAFQYFSISAFVFPCFQNNRIRRGLPFFPGNKLRHAFRVQSRRPGHHRHPLSRTGSFRTRQHAGTVSPSPRRRGEGRGEGGPRILTEANEVNEAGTRNGSSSLPWRPSVQNPIKKALPRISASERQSTRMETAL